MTLTQQTFLGASITGFNANVGWDTGVGTLTVDLVEDPKNGDSFAAPIPGAPVYFEYDNWRFAGLLSTVEEKRSFSGNRVLSVTVTDPRPILEGVQLILDNYTGSTFGIPNLYNVYGFLENASFGSSGRNEVGMPWRTVRNTAVSLVNTTPIIYKGFQYFLDLSGLPAFLPDTYRTPGTNISLLEFIQDVCSVASSDFVVKLNGNIITVFTHSRLTQPSFGKIEQFLNALSDGSVSNTTGFELENHTTSKFLVGGPVEQVFFNTSQDGEEDDYTDDTIWPFWGLDDNENVLIGEYTGVFHRVTVDGKPLTEIGIGNWNNGYPIDIQEMRRALDSQESWESFLIQLNGVDTINIGTEAAPENIPNIHKGKADALNLITDFRFDIKTWFEGLTPAQKRAITGPKLFNLLANARERINDQNQELKQNRVYEFVKNYATEFYGRKFMVRIPFVLGYQEPETNRIITSLEPTESGYVEESQFAQAVGLGLVPGDIHNFTDDRNKLKAYVKFSDFDVLDISALSDDDYYLSENNIFVKCELDAEIVYLNKSNLFSPRVVITLPGPVADAVTHPRDYAGALKAVLEGLTEEEYNELFRRFGGELLHIGIEALFFTPDLAAVPLKSNILTYGPWYATGAQGRTDFTINEQMVPWNFNSYSHMNTAGQAEVNTAYAARQISEAGSIELPGAPGIELGQTLVIGGPYVSQVQTSISTEGVKTTYRLKNWEVKPGKITRFEIDRQARLAKLAQEQRRKFRELFRPFKPLDPTRLRYKPKDAPRRKKPGSSHHVIAGDIITPSGEVTSTANVVSLPLYNLPATMGKTDTEWKSKGGMTLDGLLRPFSTDPNASGISKYIEVASGVRTPNLTQLNPFVSGHDIDVVFQGNDFPDNLAGNFDTNNIYRPLALKSPLVLSGFGYNLSGVPVPNSGDGTSQFHQDYLRRQDLWKTGPLETFWDQERGVWTGGDKISVATLTSTLYPGSGATCDVGGASGNITDPLFRNFAVSGEQIMVFGAGGSYQPLGENGLMRVGTTKESIGANGTGSVALELPGTASGLLIPSAYDWMFGGNTTLPSGLQVNNRYFTDIGAWRIIGAACNVI